MFKRALQIFLVFTLLSIILLSFTTTVVSVSVCHRLKFVIIYDRGDSCKTSSTQENPEGIVVTKIFFLFLLYQQ